MGFSTWIPTTQDIPADPTQFITGIGIDALSSQRVDVDGDGGSALFGNLCLGPDNGRTLGFWSNRNGFALFDAGGDPVADNLALLNDLPLADFGGSIGDFDNYFEFRTWLLDANGKNMAYMLSAQLAAMSLNVNNGLVIGDDLLFVPGFGVNNLISVNDLMLEAIVELNAHPVTIEDGTDRTKQTQIKDALDDANNNKNIYV